MPSDFSIVPEHRVVVSKGSGVFTHADFLDHMSRLGVDPHFNPDFDQIVDCRAIAKMDLSADQISDLASRSVFAAGSRRAFVVPSEVQFGLTRMFAAYREVRTGQQVGVFRSMDEALSWLGLPADFLD